MKTWRHWSAEEVDRAVALRRDGLPIKAVAAALGRGIGATHAKLLERGVRTPDPRLTRPGVHNDGLAPDRSNVGRSDGDTAPSRAREWSQFLAAFAGVRFADADEPRFAPPRGPAADWAGAAVLGVR